MTEWLRPSRLRLIQPDHAREVIGPAYDLLSRRDRRRLAKRSPRSFLHATRTSADFPSEPRADILRSARAYLEDRIAEGAYRDEREGLFVYRITSVGRSQTGVVGDVPVAAFPDLVRPHEHTRPDREDQLVEYLAEVGYGSSPIGLTYPASSEVDALVAEVAAGLPILDIDVGGERQTVWHVPDGGPSGRLTAAFADVGAAYIIDGHHRVAAASRHASTSAAGPDDPAGRFLAVAFPDDQLEVFPYHRWIHADWPGGGSWSAGSAPWPEVGEAVAVSRAGWRVIALEPLPGEQDTTALSRTVLGPVFGVTDERTDDRLVFIPGALGPGIVRKRVAKRGGVGFVLHPTALDAMIEISDRREVMPPKSTFFAPKPRSGIFLVDRRA